MAEWGGFGMFRQLRSYLRKRLRVAARTDSHESSPPTLSPFDDKTVLSDDGHVQRIKIHDEPTVLSPTASALVSAAASRVGRVTPPNSSPSGSVKHKHYTEWVDRVKELKREGRIDEAVALLRLLADATEDEAEAKGWGVAPWYFEQLAICFRKQKDLAAEVAILQRYAALHQAPGQKAPELAQRLVKATVNLESSLR